MHPHQTAMAEWVAVIIAQGALGGGAYVREDQMRGGLGGNSLEVDAVPCWCRRCKYARLWTKFRVCVVSDTKTIPCERSVSSDLGLRKNNQPLCGLLISKRSRESKDCVSTEWDGSRI